MSQQTIVTANIPAYAGGTVVAKFQPQGGGKPPIDDSTVTGAIDADGNFSLMAWNNDDSTLAPSVTVFLIYITVAGITYSYNATLAVTGDTEDISDAFTDAPAPPTPGGGGVDSVFTRTGDVVAASGDYSFAQISGTASLTSQVTGTLPVANGGTGSAATPTAGQIPIAASGTVLTPRTMSGDGTISSTGVFAAAATLAKLAVANTWALLQTFTSGIAIAVGQAISWNGDTGISRTAAGAIAVGNGTAGNATGSVTAAAVVAPSVTAAAALIVGTTSNNTISLETNSTPRWVIGTAPGNLTPFSTNASQSMGDATHQLLGVFANNLISVIGAPVASAATIAPTASIFHITGIATITTITPPTGFDSTHGGTIRFIADAVFAIATGGNIANAIPTVGIGTLYAATWDGTAWYIK